MKKGQSIMEYFLLLGVIIAIVVVSSGTVKTKIEDKLAEYRDSVANEIIK